MGLWINLSKRKAKTNLCIAQFLYTCLCVRVCVRYRDWEIIVADGPCREMGGAPPVDLQLVHIWAHHLQFCWYWSDDITFRLQLVHVKAHLLQFSSWYWSDHIAWRLQLVLIWPHHLQISAGTDLTTSPADCSWYWSDHIACRLQLVLIWPHHLQIAADAYQARPSMDYQLLRPSMQGAVEGVGCTVVLGNSSTASGSSAPEGRPKL